MRTFVKLINFFGELFPHVRILDFKRGGNSKAGDKLARNIGIDLLKLASSCGRDFYKNI